MGILGALRGKSSLRDEPARVTIAPLDDNGDIDTEIGIRSLQFYPESLSEQQAANWQSTQIAGLIRPHQQWVSGGERTFSFDAHFYRDFRGEISKDVDEDRTNVDIDAALTWLSILCSPSYGAINGVNAAKAPPVLWVHFEGMLLGYNKISNREEGIYCVMTDLSIERKNWFHDGVLRHATASMSFTEILQIGQNIFPYGRKDMIVHSSNYKRGKK